MTLVDPALHAATHAGAHRPTVRVMTLNLNNDPTACADRLAAAAEVVRVERPDVLLVQEVVHRPEGGDVAHALAERCGMPVVGAAAHDVDTRGNHHGVAVLSTLAGGPGPTLTLPDHEVFARRAASAVLHTPSGRPLVAVTAHLAWGGHREPTRLAEAVLLDRWVEELVARVDPAGVGVAVLGGDFNASPDSSTVRFLTGLLGAGERGAYWVDAWAAAGDGSPGLTSTPVNPWVAQTGRLVGIADPSLIPARRIDYVMVRGWVHGRAGSPLHTHLSGTVPAGPAPVLPSDHYGVVTDLWDPPLP